MQTIVIPAKAGGQCRRAKKGMDPGFRRHDDFQFIREPCFLAGAATAKSPDRRNAQGFPSILEQFGGVPRP
ncbi:MAG: hypothetical protein KA124_15265, partial [Luteimonas sp.]|nr:hypothetical protein [Luteimonas sp.]